MNIINFYNISFKYKEEFENIEELQNVITENEEIIEEDQEIIEYKNIFTNLSIDIPEGITSLIGQNGTGKSTFMLLASGILLPDTGNINIFNIDTRNLRDEKERQRYCSFIYQNMEFETEEKIGDLLNFIYENSFYEKKDNFLIPELIKNFELDKVLNKKTQEVSKGELQRTIMAFAILYGSKIIFMDEPIFALEDYQKEKVMKFLINFSKSNNISVLYSVHELDISRKFSDNLLVFYKNKNPLLYPTNTENIEKIIEEAYEIPYIMLKKKEFLYRDYLKG